MLSLSHKNHHANTLSSLHSATSSGDDGDGKLNQQRHPRIMSWLITRSCFPSRRHNIIIPESSIVKLELFLKISRSLQFEYSTLRARYIRQVHILQARPNWWCWCRWWWEESDRIIDAAYFPPSTHSSEYRPSSVVLVTYPEAYI